MSKALDVEKVAHSYGRTKVLRGVSFDAAPGEIVTIIGPNGAGKSTLLNVVARTLRLRQGRVSMAGKDTGRLRQSQVVAAGLVLVPEGRQVFSTLSVADNLLLGGYTRRRNKDTKENLDLVYSIFPRLHERQGQLAGTLSGGEQQMLAIGRAMMSRPTVMLLDEPSLGLAPQMTARIMSVLGQLRNEQRLTIVLVEQNANAALALADRGYLLSGGEVIRRGTATELRADPVIQHVYLGGTASSEPVQGALGTTLEHELG